MYCPILVHYKYQSALTFYIKVDEPVSYATVYYNNKILKSFWPERFCITVNYKIEHAGV